MLKGSGESGYSEKELFDSLGISSIDHENVREALKFLEAAPAENREPKQLVIHKEGIWVACDV
jgi:hypothetical protein